MVAGMSAHPWNSPIFVYGPPGSGKTRTGQALAAGLGLPFIDLDEQVAARAGMSIARMVAEQGEAAFRQLERLTLQEHAAAGRVVIALGGGALLDPANRRTAEEHGDVVCLSGRYETLLARLSTDEATRPLLAGDLPARLSELLERRAGHYASFPLRVDTDELTPEQAAWQIQVRLGRFLLPGEEGGCPILLAAGGLEGCGEAAQAYGLRGPLALVSDENVSRIHLARTAQALRSCGYLVTEIVLPAGEAHKTIETVGTLWSAFLEGGLERSSTVVTLGGGVVSDLAGFAAATYLRGIRWMALPTTLLAMVDAALGGKTGADLPVGKNLIGAFHAPRLVLADPETLETLPEVERINGMAEALKHGVVADPRLFEICAGGWDTVNANWDEFLRRAIAVKVAIVREDPFEQGRRAALNLGHSIGHAIETASSYRLRHGEAVAIGMVAEARLAERIGLAGPGLAAQIAAALSGLGLPVRAPEDLDRVAIERAIQVDKKRLDGKVRFALPAAIGDVRVGVQVERSDLAEIMRTLNWEGEL
jgi:shikimate kinase / 3-dehydroquinate synthase